MASKPLILGIAVLLGASVQAIADEAQPAPQASPAAPAQETPAAAPAAATPAATPEPPVALRRVQYAECTGSRIRRPPGEECPSFSLKRSYTQQDLQRTGQINVADALRLLDPIFFR